jgi:hypothetical protein
MISIVLYPATNGRGFVFHVDKDIFVLRVFTLEIQKGGIEPMADTALGVVFKSQD